MRARAATACAPILGVLALLACPRGHVEPATHPVPDAQPPSAPTQDLSVVARSSRAFRLFDVEGAVLVRTGSMLHRIEAGKLVALPPPPASDAGPTGWSRIDAVLGRWPEDARVYVLEGSSSSCSWTWNHFAMLRWATNEWTRVGTVSAGASMGTTFPHGPWIGGRILTLGYNPQVVNAGPTGPTMPSPRVDLAPFPECKGATYSVRFDQTWASGAFAVAHGYALCADYDAKLWVWATGSPLGRFIPLPAELQWFTMSGFTAASATDMELVGEGKTATGMKPIHLRFDGKTWRPAALPADTEHIESFARGFMVITRATEGPKEKAPRDLLRRDQSGWSALSLDIVPSQVVVHGDDIWVAGHPRDDLERGVLLHNGAVTEVAEISAP